MSRPGRTAPSLQEQLANAQAMISKMGQQNKKLSEENKRHVADKSSFSCLLAALESRVEQLESQAHPLLLIERDGRGPAGRSEAKGGIKLITAMGMEQERYNRVMYLVTHRFFAHTKFKGTIENYSTAEIESAVAAIQDEIPVLRHYKNGWPARDFITQNLQNVDCKLNRELKREWEADEEDRRRGGFLHKGVRRPAIPAANPDREQALRKQVTDKDDRVAKRERTKAVNAASKGKARYDTDSPPIRPPGRPKRRLVVESDDEQEASSPQSKSPVLLSPSRPSTTVLPPPSRPSTRRPPAPVEPEPGVDRDEPDTPYRKKRRVEHFPHHAQTPSPVAGPSSYRGSWDSDVVLHTAEWSPDNADEMSERAQHELPITAESGSKKEVARKSLAVRFVEQEDLSAEVGVHVSARIRDTGEKNGWNRKIDWRSLPARIQKFASYILALIGDPKTLENDAGWLKFLECIDYKVWLFVKTWLSNASSEGYRNVFPKIEETLHVGYYGPRGGDIVMRALEAMLARVTDEQITTVVRSIQDRPKAWGKRPAEPEFYKDIFIEYVLVRMVTAELIAEDLEFSDTVDPYPVVTASHDYGVLVNSIPNTGPALEVQEIQITRSNQADDTKQNPLSETAIVTSKRKIMPIPVAGILPPLTADEWKKVPDVKGKGKAKEKENKEAQDSSVKQKKTAKKRAKAPSESQGALRRSTRSAKEESDRRLSNFNISVSTLRFQDVSLSPLDFKLGTEKLSETAVLSLQLKPVLLQNVSNSDVLYLVATCSIFAFSLGGSPPPRTFSIGKYLLFPLSAQVLTRLIHSASSNSAMIASTKKDVPAAHSASSGVTRDPGRRWGTYELPKVRSCPPSNKAVPKKTPRVPLLPSPAHILKPQSASSPSDRRERHCLHAPNTSSSVRRVATPFVAVSSAYTQASVRIVAIRSPRKTLLLIGTSAGLNAPDASSSVRRVATLSAVPPQHRRRSFESTDDLDTKSSVTIIPAKGSNLDRSRLRPRHGDKTLQRRGADTGCLGAITEILVCLGQRYTGTVPQAHQSKVCAYTLPRCIASPD
ncbi:hypothetical protein GGX14DRAFT_392066 [Mycena pura]|uniref:Restriction of telomere capping protein 4 C-terminal domain-containing protein n=1 Tax=Mycena pura TaxID=153505 RepID=A0AAD6VNC8_9AGAR|nr:hypothetical protein GGX14DRAFT_392066 [Mycena pura]